MSTPRDPEEVTAAGAPAVAAVPADTRMGAVHLSVSDLARSVAYYERAIGLRVHARGDGRAALGTGGEDLLVLREEAGAQPARGYSGLYHFALLVPERTDLARWLAHAAREQVPIVGVADHYVSEAIYLSDPTSTGSRSTGTARARSGRGRSPSG
jgi:catechol 2,3-dioxygenase